MPDTHTETEENVYPLPAPVQTEPTGLIRWNNFTWPHLHIPIPERYNLANHFNFNIDVREIGADIWMGVIAAGIFSVGIILLLTSVYSCNRTSLVYNNTAQFLYVSAVGPGRIGYRTEANPTVVFPYTSLNITLNDYNSYADVYFLNGQGQIHLYDHGQNAILKNAPSNKELVKDRFFNYFWTCHYTLQKKSSSSSNVNATANVARLDHSENEPQSVEVSPEALGINVEEQPKITHLRGSFFHKPIYTEVRYPAIPADEMERNFTKS
jgi:hypothetical protein